MKKVIEKFYGDNKSAFEVVGVLLVVTGLMLNVQASSHWVSESLSWIKFLLLLGSDVLIIYLLTQGLVTFIEPLLTDSTKQTSDKKVQQASLIKTICLVVICFLILLLFGINLSIYLFLSYPKESFFTVLTLLSFFIAFKVFSKIDIDSKPWKQHLGMYFLSLLLIGIPVAAYFSLLLINYKPLFILGLPLLIAFIIYLLLHRGIK